MKKKKEKIDWTKNAILYCETKKAGACPYCKSEKVEVTEHKGGHRTSVTFQCKDCGKWAHFD